jgi:DNA polymerase III subunit alpha
LNVRVKLNGGEEERSRAFQELIARKPGPAAIRIVLEKPREFSLTLDLASKVRVDKEFKAELAKIYGSTSFEASGEA